MSIQYYKITGTGKSYALDKSTGKAQEVSSIPSGGATITWNGSGLPSELQTALPSATLPILPTPNATIPTPTPSAGTGSTSIATQTPTATVNSGSGNHATLSNGYYTVYDSNGTALASFSSGNGAELLPQYGLSASNLSSNSTNGATGITKQLELGMNDPQVLALQKFLNANGFPVASSGPGSSGNETSYFGPATLAAVQAYQKSQGIASSGDPASTGYGRVGPQTLQSMQTFQTNNQQMTVPGGDLGNVVGVTTTGDATLDSLITGLMAKIGDFIKGSQIPAGLQITPELIQKFLGYAHQVVDPQTQQLIQSKITDINANLKNQADQYGYAVGGAIQDFGTNLANEQENAGGAGTAFSGQRGINEGNLVAGTNRTLASLGSTASYNMGQTLRGAGADVGVANAGGFALPSVPGVSVSAYGGSRGSSDFGGNLDLGFNPNLYKAGNIATSQNTALNNLQGNYINQYGTLAGNNSNSGRSITDLIGMMSGLPSNT